MKKMHALGVQNAAPHHKKDQAATNYQKKEHVPHQKKDQAATHQKKEQTLYQNHPSPQRNKTVAYRSAETILLSPLVSAASKPRLHSPERAMTTYAYASPEKKPTVVYQTPASFPESPQQFIVYPSPEKKVINNTQVHHIPQQPFVFPSNIPITSILSQSQLSDKLELLLPHRGRISTVSNKLPPVIQSRLDAFRKLGERRIRLATLFQNESRTWTR